MLAKVIVDSLDKVPMVQDKESVEGSLWKTCRTLAITEANVHLLSNLTKIGLATNDVGSFALKQSSHKKVNSQVDKRVVRSAMRSKLVDALSYAKRAKGAEKIW